MYLLRDFDRKLSELKTGHNIIAAYHAAKSPMHQRNDTVTPDDIYYCSGAVNFVIGYVLAGSPNYRNKVFDIYARQANPNSQPLSNGAKLLTASTAPAVLSTILSLKSDYFILMSAKDKDHTVIVVSYGLVGRSRTWGFYQANANRYNGTVPFTISKVFNDKELKLPDQNRTGMDRAAFSAFFLSIPNNCPQLAAYAGSQWMIDVMSFKGEKLI